MILINEHIIPDPRIWNNIIHLNNYYPEIAKWYREKYIPSLKNGDGKLLMAIDDGKLVGFAMLKKSQDENKIRCLRVDKKYQDTGVGIRLIDKSIELLEDEKPVVTVAEEMIHLYSRSFVNRYGFELTDVNKGLYLPKKLEYCFNV